MGVYHYCSTIYFGGIGQQTREIGTNVTCTFLGVRQCSYLSKWVIFGGKSELFCTKLLAYAGDNGCVRTAIHKR